MFDKFNEESQKVLVIAKKEMQELKHPYVGSEHLLLGILSEENSVSNKLKLFDLTYKSFKDELIKIVGKGNIKSEWFLFTPLLKRVISNAIIDSKENNESEVTIENLFLSILEEGEGVAVRIMIGMNIDLDKVYSIFSKNLIKKKKSKKKMLIEEIGVDITNKARNDELDPVIGREKEISRILEILCRRTKNNPILIGEPGVGKTAIVEELARMIASDNVPNALKNKKIISLDMATTVAGTKYRGEFEEKIKRILEELEENTDIILFIDEIHTLVGAGGAEGAIDASNIFKPALSRGKMRCIGATTTDEYKKYIQNDGALDRRFQKILIESPDNNMVKEILINIKNIYEKYHNVYIEDRLIDKIIELSNKYLNDRNQPDKSIDILDEVCSRVSLKKSKSEIKINELYRELKKTIDEKNEYIVNNDFDKAYLLKDKEESINTIINNLELKSLNKTVKKVTEEDIKSVIKNRTKAPILNIKNNSFIKEMSNKLKNKILGQDQAIEELLKVSKRLRFDNKESSCISFLFAGPTGVGKTDLAKLYGEYLVGKDNVIKLDMSEYSESHTISKIIGAPPGYIGYSDNKNILEEIKDKPNALIILDEIERCHKSILNIFLQILDEGKIKDSKGQLVRFDNTIIIMTTNIGFNKKSVGFNSDKEEDVMSKLKNILGVEFINRIYKTIIFNKLEKEIIAEIVKKEIAELKQKYPGIDIKTNKKIISEIVDASKYKDFGARRINKIIKDEIESRIIDTMLNNEHIVNISSLNNKTIKI